VAIIQHLSLTFSILCGPQSSNGWTINTREVSVSGFLTAGNFTGTWVCVLIYDREAWSRWYADAAGLLQVEGCNDVSERFTGCL